jgi:hypothetical protein
MVIAFDIFTRDTLQQVPRRSIGFPRNPLAGRCGRLYIQLARGSTPRTPTRDFTATAGPNPIQIKVFARIIYANITAKFRYEAPKTSKMKLGHDHFFPCLPPFEAYFAPCLNAACASVH